MLEYADFTSSDHDSNRTMARIRRLVTELKQQAKRDTLVMSGLTVQQAEILDDRIRKITEMHNGELRLAVHG